SGVSSVMEKLPSEPAVTSARVRSTSCQPAPLMRLPVTLLQVSSMAAPGVNPRPLISKGLPTTPERLARLNDGPDMKLDATARPRGSDCVSGADTGTAGPSVTSNMAPITVGTAGL